MSKTLKYFLFLIILAVVAGGAFYAYNAFVSRDIVIEYFIPEEEVRIGEPFDIEVIFSNRSSGDMGDVRISLNLPDELIYTDDKNQRSVTRQLGDIKEGASHKEAFRVIAVPSESGEYKPTAVVLYSPPSISANFKRSRVIEGIRVANPRISLDISAPEKVFSGEQFEIGAKYIIEDGDNEADKDKIELRIITPEGFKTSAADPKQTVGANGWRLSDISDRNDGAATLKGRATLPDSSSFEVAAELLMRIADEEYVFSKKAIGISIAPSPLGFGVELTGGRTLAYTGDRLEYRISYRNNTPVELQNITIRTRLVGEMFDLNRIETNGRFSAKSQTIVWDSQASEGLRRLPQGSEGSVIFIVPVKSEYPISRINDKDFTLKVEGNIESPTVPYLIDADRTMNTAVLETKVPGRISVSAKGYFRDAAAGIVNKGPFPPVVGRSTNYTIHWSLANFASDVSGVEVRARLEDGVSFTGVVKSNVSAKPEWNAETREIIWRIGDLSATTGVLGEKPEAIFQIEAIPFSGMAGQYMPLLSNTEVKARDMFAEIDIFGSAAPVTTELPDDTTVQSGSGRVI